MNINIFQYLYDIKGKPIPLEYKLLNNLPLTEEDLTINGNLDLLFSDNNITLPNNLTINGNLDLYGTNLEKLPNNLYVEGYVCISYTKIVTLPDDLIVNGCLHCYFSPLAVKLKEEISLFEKYMKQIRGPILI